MKTELYDPATGTWSLTGNTNVNHHASLAPVPLTCSPMRMALLAGGIGDHIVPISSAELYDAVSGVWSATGNPMIARDDQTATLLADGTVLVAGGEDLNFDFLASAELYDPAMGSWSSTGSLLTAHTRHTATLLPGGLVLVASGVSFPDFTTDAELYDSASGTWSVTGSLNTARADHTATLLPNGLVLVAAGFGGGRTIRDSAELYDPGIPTATMVSGRSSIDGEGDQAIFSFRVTQGDGRPTGSMSSSDLAAGITIPMARVRTLSLINNSADFSGTARLGDGSKVIFEVSGTDNGDGSTDIFPISLSNGYSADGTLTSGNIQID